MMFKKGTIFIVGFGVRPELLSFLTNIAPLQSRLLVLRLIVVSVIVDTQQFIVILTNSVDLDVSDRDLHYFFDLVFKAFLAPTLPKHFSF